VLNFVWGGVLHTISHCFSLEKQLLLMDWTYISSGKPPKKRKKRKKKRRELMVMIERLKGFRIP
jgi:hypothetical protein